MNTPTMLDIIQQYKTQSLTADEALKLLKEHGHLESSTIIYQLMQRDYAERVLMDSPT